MLRTPLASERIVMTDPATGIKVVQLTSFPAPSAHLAYDWPSVTPEGRVIVCCQRWLQRNAPWDLFRVDADGLDLFQLTEHAGEAHPGGYDGHNRPVPRLSLDGRTLFVLWNGEPVIRTVDVETGRTDDLVSLDRFCPEGVHFQQVLLTGAGDALFVVLRWPRIATLRIDLASGAVDEIPLDGFLWACVPTMPRLVVMRLASIPAGQLPDYYTFARTAGERTLWTVDESGGDPRFLSPWVYSHATMLGGTARVQGCGNPPDRCVWIAGEGEPPRKIAEGPYFWHSGPSWDGEWIVADTNWPDEGLKLVHAPTGNWLTLCHLGASLAHADFGHPHPALSHDGRLAVFRSDRTGIAQIYCAHVTDEFRDRAKAGDVDRPADKWI